MQAAAPGSGPSSSADSEAVGRKDAASDHWVLFKNGAPIGTIRYYPPASKLGRMAVVKAAAGVGAGRLLSNELEKHVINRQGKAKEATEGLSEVTLVASSRARAQVSTPRGTRRRRSKMLTRARRQGFYEKLGYVAEGTHYIEVSFQT